MKRRNKLSLALILTVTLVSTAAFTTNGLAVTDTQITKALKSQITSLQKQIISLEKTLSNIKVQIASKETELKSVNDTNKTLNNQISDNNNQIDQLKKTVTDSGVQIDKLQINIANTNSQLDKLKSSEESKDNTIKELQSKLDNLTKGNSTAGALSLADTNKVPTTDKFHINLPFSTNDSKIDSASLSLNGNVVPIKYTQNNSNIEISPMEDLQVSSKYIITLSTISGKKYIGNVNTWDYPRFSDIGGEVTLKVAANPSAGFNYGYYLWIPQKCSTMTDRRLEVEGNNENPTSELQGYADESAKAIASQYTQANGYARSLQTPLLVPCFPRLTSDYYGLPYGENVYPQFLNRKAMELTSGPEKRVDLQLVAMIKDADKLLEVNGIKVPEKVLMTGYSASAKFAERFTMLHPDMVMAEALGGVAGLIMLPTSTYAGETLNFPIGINDYKSLTGADFDINTWKSIPQLLTMGANDTNDATTWRDCFTQAEADQTWKVLGKNMVTERWVKTQSIIKELGCNNIQTATYAGIGHEVNGDVLNDVVDFFKANWNGGKITPIPTRNTVK